MKYLSIFLAALCAGTSCIACNAAPPTAPPVTADSQAAATMALIAKSHIDGNIPAPENFEAFLRRDLTAYFTKLIGKAVVVQFQPLRRGPTQSGIAYPKYYLWVTLLRQGKTVGAGAVRVAAIDKKRFEVTHYLAKAEMKKNPEQIDEIFPLPVGEKIRARIL